jgi:hypothetical protein
MPSEQSGMPLQQERKHEPRVVIIVDDAFKARLVTAVLLSGRNTITRFGMEAFEHYIQYLEATEGRKLTLPTA